MTNCDACHEPTYAPATYERSLCGTCRAAQQIVSSILWHGGSTGPSRQSLEFFTMPDSERHFNAAAAIVEALGMRVSGDGQVLTPDLIEPECGYCAEPLALATWSRTYFVVDGRFLHVCKAAQCLQQAQAQQIHQWMPLATARHP